jgi:predicted Zn-dependent protease
MAAHAYLDRLNAAAEAARIELANRPTERWEFFAKASFTREVEVAPEAPLGVIHVEETGVAVRSSRTGRSGFAAASGLEGEASRRAVEGAMDTETSVSVDPIPPERLLGASEVRPARPLPATGWATHVGQELARAVAGRAGGHVQLRRTIIQEGAFAWILATGDGWVARHEDTSTSIMVEVELVGDRSGVWRDWLHIAEPEAFDAEYVAAQVSDRALLTRGRLATDSGLRDIIFHPEVTAELLAAIAPYFLATPDEPLSDIVDRQGRLAAPALTVVDDRTDPRAPITGPCDGEGLPAVRTLLVDEGVPRYRLASHRDALRFSETPRGGAVRISYRDYPATGFGNLQVVTDGGTAPAQLLQSADRALYLLRPLASVAVDPATDTYRLIASGVWLDGRSVCGWHPVVELRGSLGRLLRRIEAVGTDLRWFQTSRGFVGAPSLLVRRQPVVG